MSSDPLPPPTSVIAPKVEKSYACATAAAVCGAKVAIALSNSAARAGSFAISVNGSAIRVGPAERRLPRADAVFESFQLSWMANAGEEQHGRVHRAGDVGAQQLPERRGGEPAVRLLLEDAAARQQASTRRSDGASAAQARARSW